MRGQKESEERRSVHSIFMKFRSNGSYKSSIYASTIINAPVTTISTTSGIPTLVTTTDIPPLTTTALDCGYNCSRYIYNQPVTRHSYDILTDEEREVIKEEYYKNYDLLTGLRTAASLGGTILLFSLFILYKMKCRSFRRRKSLATTHENGVTLYDTGHVAKEPSFPNGNPSLLTDIKVSGIPVFINNAGCGGGSRRSSRVVLSPEGFSGSPSRYLGSGCCNSGAGSSPHGSRSVGGQIALNAPNSPSSLGATAIEVLSTSNYSLMSICKSGLEEDLPRFRLNSESDSCGFGVMRHSVSKVDTFLAEPIIDIHIIQPTPNVSPCGSMRRLSENVATFTENLNHSDPSTVLIPLLSIPKSGRHSKGKCGASKSKCSKRSSCRTSATPDTHLSSCDLVFACRASTSTGSLTSGCPINTDAPRPFALDEHNASSSNNNHNNGVDDDNVATDVTQAVEIKFIDCSDSEVHSSFSSGSTEKMEHTNIEKKIVSDTSTIPSTSFTLQHHAQMSSRTLSETFPDDTNKEKVSETQF